MRNKAKLPVLIAGGVILLGATVAKAQEDWQVTFASAATDSRNEGAGFDARQAFANGANLFRRASPVRISQVNRYSQSFSGVCADNYYSAYPSTLTLQRIDVAGDPVLGGGYSYVSFSSSETTANLRSSNGQIGSDANVSLRQTQIDGQSVWIVSRFIPGPPFSDGNGNTVGYSDHQSYCYYRIPPPLGSSSYTRPMQNSAGVTWRAQNGVTYWAPNYSTPGHEQKPTHYWNGSGWVPLPG